MQRIGHTALRVWLVFDDDELTFSCKAMRKVGVAAVRIDGYLWGDGCTC